MNGNPIKTEAVCCDLCGSDSSDPILTGRDFLHKTPGEWTLVRCRKCHLVYLTPRPAPESFSQIYPAEYTPYQTKQDKHAVSGWVRSALQHHWGYPPHTTSWLGRFITYPLFLAVKAKSRNFDLFAWQGEGKLLDYGCGAGSYLLRMKQLGWDVIGMDMSPIAVETCRKQGLDVFQGISPAQTFSPESFDAVTLWHVIEHVPSPFKTLRDVHSILRPGGKLILATPNLACFPRRFFGPTWFPLELPRHITFLTPQTAVTLLKKAGFQIEQVCAQRHGQTSQRSFSYLAECSPRWFPRFMAKHKKLCSVWEAATERIGGASRMILHARKL